MAKRNTYFQDEVIERKIDLKQLGRTLRYVIPFKHVFILVGVLMFLSSLVALIPPLVLKQITDVVIPDKDHAQLAYMVLSMVALAIIEIGITFIHSRLMGKTSHTLIAKIRQDIFYKLQNVYFISFSHILIVLIFALSARSSIVFISSALNSISTASAASST